MKGCFFLFPFLMTAILAFETLKLSTNIRKPHLREERKLISPTAAGVGAGVASFGAMMMFGPDKNKLKEQLTRLKNQFLLNDDEGRRNFLDRSSMIEDLRHLTTGADETLSGLEADCTGKIDEIKSAVTGASNRQSNRISKLMNKHKR